MQVLGALRDAWTVGIVDLERLLNRRVDGLFARMWLHLGTALVLLGCILSLVTLVARQIAKPLQQLARVADEVRKSGDHTLRAHGVSRDEIGRLVTAFNEMLSQLDRDRVLQQELAASARAAEAQRELVEAFPIPMVVTSVPEHEVLHSNAPAAHWLGDRKTDPWAVGLEPGVRARFFQRLADQGSVDEFEVRWKGTAEPSWAVLSARRLQFQGRDSVLTAFTPINVLKVMEQRLELWAKVFEASSEGIIIMNADQQIISVNKAFCRSTHYDFYEVIGEDLGFLLEESGAEPLSAQIHRTMLDKESWQGEGRVRRRSGETYPAWLMVSAVRETKGGTLANHIGIAIDITDRKRSEERIQFLAHHDVLTELPNRSLCVQRLQMALAQAPITGEKVAVLFIDLDRFKAINDTLGHHIGDGLLRSVAGRLTQAVRSRDTVSRLGGDEFVVVMRDVAGREDVQQLVERRLIPLIRQSHPVEGHELNVSCSVGIAVYPEDGSDIDELMRRADAAMYEAKATGGGLLGVEALLRWNNATLGHIPPSEFIPIAEETGMIRAIGGWVLQQACEQWVRWQVPRSGPSARGLVHPLAHVSISVNLSAAQLADPLLVSDIEALLARTGMPAHRLELEITESQLMDNAHAAEQQLAALKSLGVQLSIDDFGTGYSSLAYLKRFDIDRLKVDKPFVHDMLSNPADMAITRAIIALGHTLGLKIVAEGVEDLAAAQVLSALDCEELQGYHFSRPLPADQLEAWARQHRGLLTREVAAAYGERGKARGASGGCRCQRLRARRSAGPGPLEVVAPQPARHVHHFANEVQAGPRLALHGLLRQRLGVHAAQRDLGLLAALGARGRQLPARQLLGQPCQGLVAGLVDGALPVGLSLRPGVGQAAGDQGGQFVGDQLAGAGLALRQRGGQVHRGREVDGQRRAFLPVAGDLQHGRARKAPVGEQQVFVEGHTGFLGPGADLHRKRQARELRIRRPARAIKSQRHQARRALGQQHGDDVLGRAVGKQLSLVFFVEGNAVLLHQRNEVGGRIA